MFDLAIIGGGVIGLSLAYVASRRGLRVVVIDRQATGQEASWAGAGILPPANLETAVHPYDKLRGLSSRLHAVWARQLSDATGIDTGYRQSGGLYVARTLGESAALMGLIELFREEQIACENVSGNLEQVEPALAKSNAHLRMSWLVPGEGQLRNPRYLAALRQVCRQSGVTMIEHCEVHGVLIRDERVVAAECSTDSIAAEKFCFTGGAWTGQLLQSMGYSIGVMPIRGQMILYQAPMGTLRHIINDGPRYLVPRDDGLILAGSTEEEVGFDKSTTGDAIDGLQTFANTLLPMLEPDMIQKTWSGLRPGTFDGLPYLGPLPDHRNAYVATGHFRSGLYLSPATAVIMTQLILDETPEVDLTPFRIGRG